MMSAAGEVGRDNYPSPEGNSAIVEAQLQVPSKDWLEVYGLAAKNLTLDQILPTIGFQQSTGHVPALQHSVPSQYADGLFIQHPDSTGKIYNLCGANLSSLRAIEKDLQEMLARLKARCEWLNTGSRLSSGVIYGRKIVILMDTCVSEHVQLEPFLDVLTSTIQDQLSHVDEFNLIRCSNGMEVWQEYLTQNSEENIASAVEWVKQTTPQTTPFKTNVVEGLVKALAHSSADHIYLFAHHEGTLRAFDLLMEKVTPSLVPVHLVVYDCKSPQALEQYKQLATGSGARCHAYCPPAPVPCDSRKNPLLSSLSSLSSIGSSSPPQRRPASGRSTSSVNTNKSRPQSAIASAAPPFSPIPTPLPNDDLLLVMAETEATRDVLAEIQALCLEVDAVRRPYTPTEEADLNEESLTSQQWLEIHGIVAKKLRYEDLVASLAFQHCNGTIQIPVPKYKHATQKIELVPHTRVVHALYCKDFVHIRWNGEKTVHVQLTSRAHRTYRAKVEGVISKCEKRLTWLKKGSRQLFGTLLESRVVVVIDTSSSVKERLGLIKEKVKELLQEQLSFKKEFTLIHFNSEVHPWRSSLVPTSPQNLDAVGQWVEGLLAEGSTNTLGALEVAMSVREVEAVYLLTDGRPDQPLEEILKRVQQLPSIPVHTISFNCADSKANFFLSQLAMNTGGRYYYFSEDASDPEGPNSYQGEDIEKLENEIVSCREELQLADHLLSECNAVRKRGKKKVRCGEKGAPTRRGRAKRTQKTAITEKKLISSKRWLEKNSLSALNLTLMDAFGPATIPHTTKHIPLLKKNVSSKVFTSLFPLAHVTHGNEVTLIHPNGVDLKSYEEKLDKQVEIYWDRLSHLAWSAISEEKRSSLSAELGLNEGAKPPSYLKHRDTLRGLVADCGWTRPQADFNLLEEEINLANNFKKYLKAVKKEAERSSTNSLTRRRRQFSSSDNASSLSYESDDSEVVGLYSPASSDNDYSLPSLLDHFSTSSLKFSLPPLPKFNTSQRKAPPSLKGFPKGQQVIVRSRDDGFYYPGVVVKSPERSHIVVQLVDKEEINVPLSDAILVGGASPCPMLNVNDYVLVRVRRQNGPHPSRENGLCDFYIPGFINVLPEDVRKGYAFYSVLVLSGKSVTCSRHGIVKIGRSKYKEICNFIKDISSNRPSKTKKSDDPETSSSHSHTSISGSSRSCIHIPCGHNDSPPINSNSQKTGSTVASSPTQGTPTQSRMSSGQSTRSSSRESSAQGTSRSQHEGEGIADHLTVGELEQILEQQKAQRELLEQQQRELSAMQYRQHQLEAELKQKKGEEIEESEEMASNVIIESQLSVHNERGELESPIYHQTEASTMTTDLTQDLSPGTFQPQQNSNRDLAPPSHRCDLAPPVVMCDLGINTDAWTQERATETDPITESRGVGTEWSQSESESDSGDVPDMPLEKMSNSPNPAHSNDAGVSTSPDHHHNIDTSPDRSPMKTPTLTLTPISSLTPSPCHSTPGHFSQTSIHPTLVASPTTPTADLTISALEGLNTHNLEEEDPLVNQHVLARWPDDGWYYRGVVVQSLGELWYQVEDASHDADKIHALDIITDLKDAQKPIQVGDTVAALHPHYDFSYAPGKVTGITSEGLHYSVELYDGTKSFLPRQDLYHLAQAKHFKDVEYLKTKEKAWVGKDVVARRDETGLYLPGSVVEQLEGSCQYLIKWADKTTQEQSIVHMFGNLTKRRALRLEDHVLALAVPCQGVYMPGTIKDKVENKLQVEFCDGQNALVEPIECFWLSAEYFQEAVEMIANNVTPSSSQVSLKSKQHKAQHADQSDQTSEYSASYLH